jgi:hypothetical protein
VETLFVGEPGEVVGCGGIFGVDAADALKFCGVLFQNGGEVAVVPAVVDDLDEDGSGDAVGLHEFEELFDGGVFGGRMRAGSEGESWVVLPDVDVGVDEDWFWFGGA